MGPTNSKQNTRERVDYVKQNLVKIPKELRNYPQLRSLNIAGNQIDKYPKWLTQNTSLTYLNCTHNSLQMLPPNIYKLQCLEQLDGGFNEIEGLSPTIGTLAGLTRLDLRHNKIKTLPTTVNSLSSLETLILLNNEIETLPSLNGMDNLINLHLDGNKVVELNNHTFSGLCKLEYLDLSYNDLKSIPKKLFNDLANLKKLYLNGNQLKSIGKGFESLQNLVILEANFNKIETITMEISNLKKIKKISLKKNAIRNLPNEFQKLDETLIEILLTDNNFEEFPNLLLTFEYLEKIDFESNAIKEIKINNNNNNNNNNNKKKKEIKLKFLKTLNISKNDIQYLDDNIFLKLFHLEKLILHHNNLKELPVSIGKLTNLKLLFLRSNLLTRLPNEIGSCASLQTLSLAQNQLFQLPDELGNLVSLRKLLLEDNNLKELPNSLNKLEKLEILNLSLNNFHTFPKAVCQITQLRSLQLAHNKINYVPNEIIKLQRLIELDINCNRIVFFPRSFGYFENLQIISLAGNRITRIPQKFFELNTYTRFGGYQIDFSHNRLKKIGQIWAKLLGLTDVLDLSHNQIQKVLIKKFEHSSQVGTLKLSHNKITKLNLIQLGLANYLKQLHIEGNAYDVNFKKLLQQMKKNSKNFIKKNNKKNKKNNNKSYSSIINYLSESIAHFNYITKYKQQKKNEKLSKQQLKQKQQQQRQQLQEQQQSNNNNFFEYNKLYFRHLIELLVDPLGGDTIGRQISTKTNRFSVGYSQSRGKYDQMEDSLLIRTNLLNNVDLFAIFDGHGGRFTAMYAADLFPMMIRKALLRVFKQLKQLNNSNTNKNDLKEKSEDFLIKNVPKLFEKVFSDFNYLRKKIKDDDSGCTVSIILIIGQLCFSSNLGNIKSLILRKNNEIKCLTQEHKPENPEERSRIIKLGGIVTDNGSINSSLAISRALGDLDFQPFVSYEPSVSFVRLKETDERMIITTSSIWELIPEKKLFEEISNIGDPFKASFHLRTIASSLCNTENLSICVINLLPQSSSSSSSSSSSGQNNKANNLIKNQQAIENRKKRNQKEQQNENNAKLWKKKDKKINFENYIKEYKEKLKQLKMKNQNNIKIKITKPNSNQNDKDDDNDKVNDQNLKNGKRITKEKGINNNAKGHQEKDKTTENGNGNGNGNEKEIDIEKEIEKIQNEKKLAENDQMSLGISFTINELKNFNIISDHIEKKSKRNKYPKLMESQQSNLIVSSNRHYPEWEVWGLDHSKKMKGLGNTPTTGLTENEVQKLKEKIEKNIIIDEDSDSESDSDSDIGSDLNYSSGSEDGDDNNTVNEKKREEVEEKEKKIEIQQSKEKIEKNIILDQNENSKIGRNSDSDSGTESDSDLDFKSVNKNDTEKKLNLDDDDDDDDDGDIRIDLKNLSDLEDGNPNELFNLSNLEIGNNFSSHSDEK
ncbi:hypothetical protein M0812_08783 [Anaeramoeba flamelloides]|uniref:PPM-type phosphatase domain-containing protein n=1 Tax=Anaeramoeba flamelloides TaxID=1746091 RepID=A0AAV7ZZM6_9EUKA|nr:hypothetical protein M0812_08783 [Anaeramoeba flamelloides]